MYARVIHATISYLAEAKRSLDEEVLPTIKGSPGFLGAYFMAVDDSHGVSIEVFETDEQARAFRASRRHRSTRRDGGHRPVRRRSSVRPDLPQAPRCPNVSVVGVTRRFVIEILSCPCIPAVLR